VVLGIFGHSQISVTRHPYTHVVTSLTEVAFKGMGRRGRARSVHHSSGASWAELNMAFAGPCRADHWLGGAACRNRTDDLFVARPVGEVSGGRLYAAP